MDLSFYPLTLEAIDQADAESLCLFVGEDERPLTGLAGLADWRLSGGLSRLLRKGLVQGSAGEALLTPGLKLGFRKLFLFGLGPIGNQFHKSAQPAQLQDEDELAARVAECLRRMQAAGVENAAMQLPARLPLDLGIRTLIDEAQAPARALVFGPDPAALVRALSHAASRGPMESKHERRVIKVPGPPRPAPPVRVGPPPKQAPVEVPKASPLSFAPSNARGTGAGAGGVASAPAATVGGPAIAAPPTTTASAPAAATATANGPNASSALVATVGAPTIPAATAAAPAPATAAPAVAAPVAAAPVVAAPVVAAPAVAAPAVGVAPLATPPVAAAPIAPPVAGPNSEPETPIAPHVPDSIPPVAKAAVVPVVAPAPAAATASTIAVPPAVPPKEPAAPVPAEAAVVVQTAPAKTGPVPAPVTAAKPVPATPPAAPPGPAEPPPKLPAGKSPLPIDHKAQRFVPPKPKVVENGKGKKKP